MLARRFRNVKACNRPYGAAPVLPQASETMSHSGRLCIQRPSVTSFTGTTPDHFLGGRSLTDRARDILDSVRPSLFSIPPKDYVANNSAATCKATGPARFQLDILRCVFATHLRTRASACRHGSIHQQQHQRRPLVIPVICVLIFPLKIARHPNSPIFCKRW